ncbi:Protein ERP1 [Verticillium dahliae VDG2]|nr:Protein ERP1 [Verticillium dahliae VDG2]
MFDIFAHLLSSVASFLFPLFASYKALKTSDPAQLTPWLMYWVVLACVLLVESWTEWFLGWIPFHAYLRLFFLLYLVLPQTQGARLLYETYVHPFLEDNETQIEAFIADLHDRAKAAGISYIRQAIEFIKTNVFGLPPSPPEPESPRAASYAPQSYTQSLLARFSVPNARWAPPPQPASSGSTGGDFYSLLAGAVSAATRSATSPGSGSGAGSGVDAHRGGGGGGGWGGLIPSNLTGATEKMSFIAAQRERLNVVLDGLDREAQTLQREETLRARNAEDYLRPGSISLDGEGFARERPFETIDAESGGEDEGRARPGPGVQGGQAAAGSTGSWMPWGWSAAKERDERDLQYGRDDHGRSSGYDRDR